MALKEGVNFHQIFEQFNSTHISNLMRFGVFLVFFLKNPFELVG